MWLSSAVDIPTTPKDVYAIFFYFHKSTIVLIKFIDIALFFPLPVL